MSVVPVAFSVFLTKDGLSLWPVTILPPTYNYMDAATPRAEDFSSLTQTLWKEAHKDQKHDGPLRAD